MNKLMNETGKKEGGLSASPYEILSIDKLATDAEETHIACLLNRIFPAVADCVHAESFCS